MEASAGPMTRAVVGARTSRNDVGHKGTPERVDDADQHRCQEGATDRADAADHDHHECEDQNLITHTGLHRQDRRHHYAGKAGQHGAEAEHDHEQPLDVDAERRDHWRVGGARAHQHAKSG